MTTPGAGQIQAQKTPLLKMLELAASYVPERASVDSEAILKSVRQK
jgi:hypothetical protein